MTKFEKGLAIGASAVGAMLICGNIPESFVAPMAEGRATQPRIVEPQQASLRGVVAANPGEGAATPSMAPICAVGAFACAAVQGLKNEKSKKRKAKAALVGGALPVAPRPVPAYPKVTCNALDQSSRYADLGLVEEELMAKGEHVLVAYIMKPKAGYDYLATAAHFAAESSTGTNVNVCTTDDFTKTVDALVYYIDPEEEEMKIAYPCALFDRNITDGRAMMCSVLTLTIGNNQGMGDVEYGKIYDIYFPPPFLRLFDGPAVNIVDMWRLFGRSMTDGGLVVGTIIKPKLGLQPKPFGEACYAFWQGGDFIKNDEPQGNQTFCQMKECIPVVVDALKRCIEETGDEKIFSANITADDPKEMIARGRYILHRFGQFAQNCALLVDGYVAGGTAITCCRRNFPNQFLHYHRAGHGAVTSPQTQRGYTAFVHTKISRVIGASGIHVGTMSFGKMEGDASDKNIAFMLQDDVADGPYYRQEWQGMKQTTPIISGGMNALRLPAFFENLGHSNVILTAGGGSFGHKDGPKQGAISCRQGETAWKAWKDGAFGNVSLSDGVVEFAKTHEELKGAFLTFQKDADQIYPGWKEKLGYTGESSVQAASFDWAKKGPSATSTPSPVPAAAPVTPSPPVQAFVAAPSLQTEPAGIVMTKVEEPVVAPQVVVDEAETMRLQVLLKEAESEAASIKAEADAERVRLELLLNEATAEAESAKSQLQVAVSGGTASEALAKSEAAKGEAIAEAARLQAQLDSRDAETAKMKEHLADFFDKLQKERKETESLKGRMKAAEQESAKLQAEVDRLTKELDNADELAKMMRAEVSAAKTELEAEIASMQELRKQIGALQEAQSELGDMLENSQNTEEATKAQRAKLEASLKESEKKAELLTEKLEEKNDFLKAAEEQLNSVRSGISAAFAAVCKKIRKIGGME